MELVTVESSAISAIGYDPATQELEVIFTSGKTYRYSGVPETLYTNLLAADSKGRYLQKQIIGAYPSRLISRRQRG